jgi:hypothetical protein
MLLRIIVAFFLLTTLQACDYARPDLKSPCVGIEDSPCGPKRSVNDWWIKKQVREHS